MANRNYLQWAQVPPRVSSGAAFSITVAYEAEDGQALTLSVDDGFSIAPASHPLPTASQATFEATITRDTATTRRCIVMVSVGDSHAYPPVEVT